MRDDTQQGIVVGQKVKPEKVIRAKELRHEMTDAERILWRHLRANQFHGLRFRRQQVIDGFIVDFYCHAARLIIEVDGDIHSIQREYDSKRDQVIEARGIQILRVSNGDIQTDLIGVLAHIAAVCASGSPSPRRGQTREPRHEARSGARAARSGCGPQGGG